MEEAVTRAEREPSVRSQNTNVPGAMRMPMEGAIRTEEQRRRVEPTAVLLRLPDLSVPASAPPDTATSAGAVSGSASKRAASTRERIWLATITGDVSTAVLLPWATRFRTWWLGGGGKVVIWAVIAIATLVLAAWLQIHSSPTIPAPDYSAPASAESAAPIRKTADWNPPPVPPEPSHSQARRPVITGMRPYPEPSEEPRNAQANRDAASPAAQPTSSEPGNASATKAENSQREATPLAERMKRAMQYPLTRPNTEPPTPTVRR